MCWGSTLEWTLGEVIVNSGIGPIHHVFLSIRPLNTKTKISSNTRQQQIEGLMSKLVASPLATAAVSEPVFLNVYGAQESIPRNEFRQSM
jgi:hypothetical protein